MKKRELLIYRGNVAEAFRLVEAHIHQFGTSESIELCLKLLPLIRERTASFIENVDTEFGILFIGNKAFPLSVNEEEWGTSYVVSPFTHYITYCLDELYNIRFKPLEAALGGTIRALGLILKRSSFNRNVHVNNFLLSTNLYPDLTQAEIREIRNALSERFPGHAIIFRSINSYPESDPWSKRPHRKFESNGFIAVASRQVYYQDPKSPALKTSKSYKKDLSLMRRTPYRLIGPDSISEQDLPRILELYGLLYIDKYSHLNPDFTVKYLSVLKATGFLELWALVTSEGRIDGVVGFYTLNGMMTTPILGYDTALPTEAGLYRMLSIVLIEKARERGLILNASSGAAEFKRSRGGVAYPEFSMVYLRHLGFRQRLGWHLVRGLVNGFLLPLVRVLKL